MNEYRIIYCGNIHYCIVVLFILAIPIPIYVYIPTQLKLLLPIYSSNGIKMIYLFNVEDFT